MADIPIAPRLLGRQPYRDQFAFAGTLIASRLLAMHSYGARAAWRSQGAETS